MRSSADSGRLANMVSRPGIDPRVWLSLATITTIAYDPAHGLFADIKLLPSGDIETALIGTAYAVDGGGLYCPVEVNDVVLVAIPGGDTGLGPVIISQMWAATQKPASEMGKDGQATGDVVLRVKQGRNLRIFSKDGEVHITGEGNGAVTIETTGTQPVTIKSSSSITVNAPEINLGDTPGQPIARVGDMVSITIPMLLSLPMGGPVLPIGVLPTATGGIPGTGKIVSGKTGIKA